MVQTTLSQLTHLRGKVAIVTGAGRGIGEAIAIRLAEAGAAVVAADIDGGNAERTAAKIEQAGGKALGIASDAAASGAAGKLVDFAVAKLDGLDILVNNAAIFLPSPVMEISESQWDRMIDLDLKAVFMHAQAAARKMIEQGRGGKIVNIASVDAYLPVGGIVPYDAAKGGIVSMTRALAKELGRHSIHVNAVAPGGINTPGAAEGTAGIMAVLGITAEAAAGAPPRAVLGRWGEPDDIAKAVYFLTTGLADYITGATLIVDGGYLLV